MWPARAWKLGVCFGGFCYACWFFQRCRKQCKESFLKPIMVVFKLRYDETPAKLRLSGSQEPCADLCSAGPEKAAAANVMGSSSSSLHQKLFQVQASVGLLLRGPEEDVYRWVEGEVPCQLFALERTTGLNIWAALRQVAGSLPHLREVGMECKFALRDSCTDKYTANSSAEKLLAAEYPGFELLHTFCSVHRLYTCTMSNADADVGGVLNPALALSHGGSVADHRGPAGYLLRRPT